MKFIQLEDLSAPTKPNKVSIRQPMSLDFVSPIEKISSNNIVVTKELATPELKREYLPIINKTLLDSLNFKKETISGDGGSVDVVINKVSNFNITNDIELQGNYPQNIVKFPKFTLNTNIKTLPDINFRFILSIKKDKSDSNPQLYTSDKFYNQLASTYWENSPYMVANAIKSEAVVSIVYADYIEKLNTFKTLESNAGTLGVQVKKNVFVEFDDEGNSSINLDNLVRYIDWIVSKPSSNYNERLIDSVYLGEWSISGSNTTDSEPETPPAPTSPPIDLGSNPTNPINSGGGRPSGGIDNSGSAGGGRRGTL